MKSLARSHVWWPGLDKNIEDMVKACVECQSVKETPPPAPLHPWHQKTSHIRLKHLLDLYGGSFGSNPFRK